MEEGKKNQNKSNGLNASFVTGAIALVFLVIGYEVALFVHKAAVTRLVANRDHPDTVYVVDEALARRLLGSDKSSDGGTVPSADFGHNNEAEGTAPPSSQSKSVPIRRNAQHSSAAVQVREKASPRKVESFRFNPNTVSLEDLQRLGFSGKQAQSIDNYRQKGGKFRRPSDFAKSYVVADSVYERLEPYIDIPRLDINKADSASLLALPGIGPYFAGKVVHYREQLGGYSTAEQLMEIYRFDREKYEGLKDLITCSAAEPYPIWSLPEQELSRHPHISRSEAHAIVLYRNNNAKEACTLEGLIKAGILSQEHAEGLGRCRLAPSQ